MNDDIRFEHLLSDMLAHAAPAREPDRLVPETLRAARRVRRWPRWLALIKEPPMRLSSRVAVGSPTIRLAYLLIVTLTLALVTLGGVVAGASLLSSPNPMIPSCGEVSCPVGSMTQTRGWHAATLLHDGRVLVVAGDDWITGSMAPWPPRSSGIRPRACFPRRDRSPRGAATDGDAPRGRPRPRHRRLRRRWRDARLNRALGPRDRQLEPGGNDGKDSRLPHRDAAIGRERARDRRRRLR